jgi:ubiquinone/menaquinone biosynthesis C-methylase UbiE
VAERSSTALRATASIRRSGFNGLPNQTRRIYDLVAGIYPLSTLLFHEKAHKVALSLSGITDKMRVLEVATGSGEMLRRLAGINQNGLTCGVDLSPNMAARTQRLARRGLPDSQVHCQAVDARRMPFRDHSFHAVVCCYLLELLGPEGIQETLDEIYRVLQPGGRLALVLIGQNVPAFNVLYKVAGGLAPAFWGCQVEQAIPEAMAGCEFDVEHDQTVQQGFYPSRVIVARK